MNTRPDRQLRWSTTFGLGHMRPFPGTWGSLPPAALAVALALPLAALPSLYEPVLRLAMLAIALLFAAACVIQADHAEARFGRKDPSEVVADETAGMALTLALAPQVAGGGPALAVATAAMAFVFFRAMDIVKPWPAGRLQDTPGGWGILLDDLAAALQAAALMWASMGIAALL